MLRALIIVLSLFATSAFAKNKRLGIGGILVSPTGVSGKYILTPKTAVDAALNLFFFENIHFHSDYLIKSKVLLKEGSSLLTAHYGVGGRYRVFKKRVTDDEGSRNETVQQLGVRGPVGLDIWFPQVPIEVFAEVALVVNVVGDGRFDFDIGIGARYYL